MLFKANDSTKLTIFFTSIYDRRQVIHFTMKVTAMAADPQDEVLQLRRSCEQFEEYLCDGDAHFLAQFVSRLEELARKAPTFDVLGVPLNGHRGLVTIV